MKNRIKNFVENVVLGAFGSVAGSYENDNGYITFGMEICLKEDAPDELEKHFTLQEFSEALHGSVSRASKLGYDFNEVVEELGTDLCSDLVSSLTAYGVYGALLAFSETRGTLYILVDDASFTDPLKTLRAYRKDHIERGKVRLQGGEPPITCNYTGYYGKQGLADVTNGTERILYFPFLPAVIPVTLAFNTAVF